jgi:hypothetical protein
MSLFPTPARAAITALLLTACGPGPALRSSFDGPLWTDILTPIEGGPFWTDIAFVSNSRDGTVVPLDLRHRTAVADQFGGPFLAPRKVAFGDQRQLGQIVAWSPGDATIDVFAVDHTNALVVQAPYIVGVSEDDEPLVPDLINTDPVFIDSDDSGDSPSLSRIELRHGFTTTEDWVVEYDGREWFVTGSASGRQTRAPREDREWTSDNRELTFTLSGRATAGDRFELSTDVGVVEHDLGGVPMSLLEVPGTDLMLVGLWDREADLGDLVVWDRLTASEVGRIALPDGAQPWRLTWDQTGTLYAGDARRSAVYIIAVDEDDPAASVVEELVTPAPIEALAVVSQEEDALTSREFYHHLFVAPVDDTRVDLYDLTTGEWVDVNPRDGVRGGLDLRSPVVGMSTVPLPIKLIEETNSGTRRREHVVAVTTFDGALRLIEGPTGCLAIDVQGARLVADVNTEMVAFSDLGDLSNPILVSDPATSRQVVSSACGGIARDESWRLIYDGVEGAWRATGTLSGEQDALVYEDQRYTIDDGGLSWVILAGTWPTTDGDTFTFTIEDGVLEMTEVAMSTTDIMTFNLPGHPLAFTMDMGPSGGGWDEDRTKAHILLPVTNSDAVIRIRPQGWTAEVNWR